MLRFGEYRLDSVQGLSRGDDEVRVTPKSLAVLRVLAERAGQVVTKDELFRLVWAETAVSDTALTSCIQELRRAFEDDARKPRFIETVHRRGYRFLPRAATASRHETLQATTASTAAPEPLLVGRDDVVNQLLVACDASIRGVRQTVFVTGDAGVGKTAVVQALLARTSARGVRFTLGQCVEHYGVGEPYQPLLEALTRLCRQPGGDEAIAAMEHHAPTWLAQLPGLLAPDRLEGLQRTTAGTTRERMLRELTGVLEAITARDPLVLWLDDLHWSDASTLDWIAAFSQRPEPARLMLIGTFRPSAISDRRQPLAVLTDALQVKGFSRDIALAGLSQPAVEEYVLRRYPALPGQEPALRRVARLVHRHTAGNSLFVVNVLSDLVARQVLRAEEDRWMPAGDVAAADLGIPDDVRRVIERQLDRLDGRDRALLEVASIAGAAFSSAAVAEAAGGTMSDVESSLGALARQTQFIRETGVLEWPDGTIGTGFEFLHELYRDVLYRSVPSGRRADVHRVVGARQEAAYGSRAPEIAAELAMHFLSGHDGRRAVTYLHHAAENARRRSAFAEARAHFDRALAVLETQPADVERTEREMTLRIGLGAVVMATEGWGSAEAERTYERARALAQQLGDAPRLFPALWGLWLFYWGRGLLATARDISNDLMELAGRRNEPALVLQAHHAVWATAFSQGNLEETRVHAERGMELYEAASHAVMAATYGSHDAGVCAMQFNARALALAGRTGDAIHMSEAAISLARDLGHAFSEALARIFAAAVCQTVRDAPGARRHADAALAIAREQDFRLLSAWAATLAEWTTVEHGQPADAMRAIAGALTAIRASGSAQFLTHYLGLFAEACLENHQPAAGLEALDEALSVVRRTGERFYEAEIYRLKGELELARGDMPAAEAEVSFTKAIDVARSQGALLLALRASLSLARLYSRTNRRADTRRLVKAALEGVGDDPPTPDAAEAEAMLRSTS